jgi:hypothetical protein
MRAFVAPNAGASGVAFTTDAGDDSRVAPLPGFIEVRTIQTFV